MTLLQGQRDVCSARETKAIVHTAEAFNGVCENREFVIGVRSNPVPVKWEIKKHHKCRLVAALRGILCS